jgi:hypothetical protein
VPELNDVASAYEIEDLEFAVSELDEMTVDVSYPRLFANTYSLQTIRLEIGPLAAWSPSSTKEIQAYVFEEFPNLDENAMISISTVEAKRTFWEKAVILHREANRNKITGYRYSRHYYDLYKMSESSVKEEAFNDMQLLKDVVHFNMKFYPVGNAKFEEATPSTFRIVPSKEQVDLLKKDYVDMGEMFFEEPVTFEEVVEGLNHLEQEINQLA